MVARRHAGADPLRDERGGFVVGSHEPGLNPVRFGQRDGDSDRRSPRRVDEPGPGCQHSKRPPVGLGRARVVARGDAMFSAVGVEQDVGASGRDDDKVTAGPCSCNLPQQHLRSLRCYGVLPCGLRQLGLSDGAGDPADRGGVACTDMAGEVLLDATVVNGHCVLEGAAPGVS